MSRRKPEMPPTTRAKLLRLRVDGKRGVALSDADQDFCEDCWKRYPKQYGQDEDEVFDITAMTVNPLWRPRAKKARR